MKKLILILLIVIVSNVYSNPLSDDYTKSEENGKVMFYANQETIKAVQDEIYSFKNLTKDELLKENKSTVSDEYINFTLDLNSKSISAKGMLVPIKIQDADLGQLPYLYQNSGEAIIKIIRNKDNKSFQLYLDKVVWLEKFPCEGMNDYDFDTKGCILKQRENLLVPNDLDDVSYEYETFGGKKLKTTLISFHDIDNDGKKELLYTKHFPHRHGSIITAFNIINTKDRFELDEDEPISIIFDATSTIEFKEKMIIDKHFDGCCAWTEYGWIADGNKFSLDYIKKNSGPDSID